MKQMISVRSNPYFTQKENEKTFQLQSCLEVVIIHTDGKKYKLGKNDFIAEANFNESRFIVNSEMLSSLITELQLHQKKLEVFRQNADKINGLINHLSKENDT
jgi:hypothetical protein